jgi:hypothetical protein
MLSDENNTTDVLYAVLEAEFTRLVCMHYIEVHLPQKLAIINRKLLSKSNFASLGFTKSFYNI